VLLDVLNSAQRAKQVSGAVAEIGVHHGKMFIGVQLLQRAGEKSVAIDVFDDQDLNVDGSGNGDLEKFVNNVNLWSSMDDVVVHKSDSTKVTPETLRELADGGIVIADDVFNEHWPGVAVGTQRYLEDGAKLAPFLIGFNKVFFAQSDYCEFYRTAVESAAARKLRFATGPSVYAGHEVTLIVAQGAKGILRKSQLARTIYHGTYRQLVRGLRVVSGGKGRVTGE
jgi:hypothetical protein